MSFGLHILAWRRYQGLTQKDLALKTGIPRPYLSRLERNDTDPSLSLVRRLASSLRITVGDLVDREPPQKPLDRFELDQLARGALRPTQAPQPLQASARNLARAFKEKRAASGLYKPRKKKTPTLLEGETTLRRFKADLGPKQWKALLARIEKHIPYGEEKKK